MKKLRPLRAERLEDRCMLHGEGPLPSVTLETNVGDITIELFPDQAPETVANFLNYVNDGDYLNAIFHRSVPGFVVQAGGFTTTTPTLCVQPCSIADINPGQFDNVPTDDPVVNEFGLSNIRGTVAMAKRSGDPNSATSQWFVNVEDNTSLDSNNGGFTVFGQVTDMATPDAINNLGSSNLSSLGFPFSEFPVNDNDGTLEAVTILSVSGTAIIAGTVFHDFDGDGSLDSGEGGLAAAEVFLDANDNAVLDDGEESTIADELGRYHFLVEPGMHVVRVLPYQSDYVSTTSDRATASPAIGQESGPDFGLKYAGTAWHNPVAEADVDAINGVTPLDALLVVNELTNREFSDPVTGELEPLTETPEVIRFFDVFEDNIVAPLDALLVINALSDDSSALMAAPNGPTPSAPAAPLAGQVMHDTPSSASDQEDSLTESILDDFFSTLGVDA